MTAHRSKTHQNLRWRKRQHRNHRRPKKTRYNRIFSQRPRQTGPNRRRTATNSNPKPSRHIHPRRRLHQNSHKQKPPGHNLRAPTKNNSRRMHKKTQNNSRNQNPWRNAQQNNLPVNLTDSNQNRFIYPRRKTLNPSKLKPSKTYFCLYTRGL